MVYLGVINIRRQCQLIPKLDEKSFLWIFYTEHTVDFHFSHEIVQIQHYIIATKYDLALKLIEEIEIRHSMNDIIYAQAQYFRAQIYMYQKEFNKALKYLELCDRLNIDNNLYLTIDTIILKLEIFDVFNNYDDISSLLSKFDKLVPLVDLPLVKETYQSKIYKIKGSVNVERKEYTLAISNFEKSIELSKYDADKGNIVGTWQYMSLTFDRLNKHDKAIEILNNAIEYIEKENLPLTTKYMILSSLGILYQAKGNLTKAEQTLLDVLDYFESLNQPGLSSGIYKSLGELYYHFGQINKAINYTNKSIESFRSMNFQIGVLASQVHLAKIKYLSNEINSAISILDDLFQYRDEFSNSMMIFEVILFRVLIYCRTDNKISIENYTEYFNKSKDTQISPAVKVVVELIDAILSLSRIGLRSKATALVKLEWIINQDEVDFELKNYSIRFVIEILLTEYKDNLSHEIFEEIIQYLELLEDNSKRQNLYPTLIETMIIRSKFLVIQGRFQESNTLLDEAINLAEKYTLEELKKQIIMEKSQLVDEFQRIKSFVEINYEFLDEIEKQEFSEYLDTIRRFRVKLDD